MGIIDLSAGHLHGESVEETDPDTGEKVLLFHLCDDESAVDITHEFGSPEAAAHRLMACAEAMRAHAERLWDRTRLHSGSWT